MKQSQTNIHDTPTGIELLTLLTMPVIHLLLIAGTAATVLGCTAPMQAEQGGPPFYSKRVTVATDSIESCRTRCQTVNATGATAGL